ncbi:unnamed protein product [Penicillium salamii]|nr:unnamed protein product [Penicillium salamii]
MLNILPGALFLAACYSRGTAAHKINVKAPEHLPPGASQPETKAIRILSPKTSSTFYTRRPARTPIFGDRAIYNASQAESIVLSTESDNGIPLEVSLGPVFFEGFENFPGTPWTFQVNLANNKSNALENALAEAKVALSHIRGDLYAFEIGNEPDLYPGDVRPLDYTVADYVKQWRTFADAISNEVLHGNQYGLEDWKLFQALTFIFYFNGFSTWVSVFSIDSIVDLTFTRAKAFENGVNADGHVKYASGNQDWVRLQESFMNHTLIASNLTQYIDDMELIHANDPNIKFLLGETNSDYVNLNMSQVEGVFGSSLWLVDYLLYGMSLNITRFNLIQGTTFGYAGWTPVEHNGVAPQVRAPLYGQIFAADAIGRHPTVQVKALEFQRDDLSAYAIYESGILARYVVVNLDEWNSTTSYPRPSQKFELDVPHYLKSVEVRRLVGPGASADTGISWGGLSWNYTDGRLGRTGKRQVEVLRVSKGTVTLDLDSTEAAIVELQHV